MFNTSLNNSLTRGNKAEIAHWAKPKYNGFVQIGFPYTCPYDGFISMLMWTSGGNCFAYVDGLLIGELGIAQSAVQVGQFIPVNKGNVITGSGKITAYFIPNQW